MSFSDPNLEVKSVVHNIGSFKGQFIRNTDVASGIVRVTNQSGWIYEGLCSNNKPNGYGRYIFEDGSYYTGAYKHGKFHGLGEYVDEQGRVFNGQWLNDKFTNNEYCLQF